MTVEPVLISPASGSRVRAGKALTGRAGLLSGQEVMKPEARE